MNNYSEQLNSLLSSPEMKGKIEVIETQAESGAKIIAAQKKQFENQLNGMRINEERFKNPKSFGHYARPLSADGRNPNMPDRQPCPDCRKSCKKISGSSQGAMYKCPTHDEFFVATAKYGRERV
jgi:hypothetical protein